jgi:thiol-disulfide isomerase/thioredoxin
MNKIILYILVLALVLMAFVTGTYSGFFTAGPGSDDTFKDAGTEACYVDGVPVIRMYSTTTCPHCAWIKDTFDSVATEYAESGKIKAHHWEYISDQGIWDDTLSPGIEGTIPQSELDVYYEFSGNGVPTFIFGCRYYRIGNGYEKQNDLATEEAEFRAVIEKLLV